MSSSASAWPTVRGNPSSRKPLATHVVVGDPLGDQPEHDLVGQQGARVDVLLGLATEVGALGHGRAQHVAGGDVRRAVVLGQEGGLRPLAGTLAPEEHELDGHYFRNPS